MKARELRNLGVPDGRAVKVAMQCCADAAAAGLSRTQIRERISAVIDTPQQYLDDDWFNPLATELAAPNAPPAQPFAGREDGPAPWQMFGSDLDANSIEQMENAARLPVAVAGALMPDAHLGYGLPIGGVLATDNAVIPYAVGVDIACRMKLTVLDLPANAIRAQTDRLINAVESETRFGIGASFRKPREHPVMDQNWAVSDVTQKGKDKAWKQLGTSGSGNHFVEFGELAVLEHQDDPRIPLKTGTYLALLSHSGSRGTGASVANYYSKLAMQLHPELPKELRHLAWLDLDSEEGQAYWNAMNLMGDYAAANHAVIHREIARHLGVDVLADIENHHNFAWKETHPHINGGRPVIVHRKGATPAGRDVLGIIPGSMADPGFIVRGKGEPSSLQSASHGAGRVMSRRQARSTFTWSQAKKLLAERDVQLLSAGLDEVPMVYKDINDVMAQQTSLVDVIARFDPKIVKMAPEGERPED